MFISDFQRFFILENVGKIKKNVKNVKNVTRIKNVKKRFFFYIYASQVGKLFQMAGPVTSKLLVQLLSSFLVLTVTRYTSEPQVFLARLLKLAFHDADTDTEARTRTPTPTCPTRLFPREDLLEEIACVGRTTV